MKDVSPYAFLALGEFDSASDASSVCLCLLELGPLPLGLTAGMLHITWQQGWGILLKWSARAGTVLILLSGDHQMLADCVVDAELLL